MKVSKALQKVCVLLASAFLASGGNIRAQVLPVLNSFRNMTFEGTLDVSWPVAFDGCTFRTDSVVLKHSYGAVFRNCRFESRSGVLYVSGSGDGMILSDCEITGCDRLMLSRDYTLADRNYISGITVGGEECSVLDDQEMVIDIDGLELSETVKGNGDGPLIMLMSADRYALKGGETAGVRLRGLEDGMFAGWLSSDPDLRILVNDDGFGCTVTAPAVIDSKRDVIISAYTEYGLEAACVITLLPDVKPRKKK